MMLVEAVAWRGLDNLFSPLIGFLFLDAWLPLDALELSERALVALVLVGFVMVYRRRTTLDDAALLGGALGGYVAYAVGGPAWLLPPLVLLLSYTRLSPATAANSARVHDILAVVAVTGPGLLWLLLDHRELIARGFLPYAASYAAQLACIGVARLAAERPDWSLARVVLTAAIFAGLLMLVPLLVLPDFGLREPRVLLVVAAAPLAAIAFAWWQPQIRDCPIDARRWWRQAICATAAAGLGLL
jgi:phytol kinase